MTTSPPWTIDHIGIAVTDLDQAIAHYHSVTKTEVTLREKLESSGVELAFLSTGGSKVELLMPLRPNTALGRFLAKRGPGLHHICYRVDNIRAELTRLSQMGARLIDSTPRPGAGGTEIAFIDPSFFHGTLTELCEYPRR
jgi:methylmalonyl-CoA epimerase